MTYATPSGKLLDKNMREGIHRYLRTNVMAEPGSMLIDELGFSAGRREGRVDVVVVNSLMHGYEIKSDADTNGMNRLSKIQINLYSQIMDLVSVVVTPKYLYSVRKMLPQFWGIYGFVDGAMYEVRRPELHTQMVPRAVAGLLWKDRALQLLSDSGLERGFAKKAKHHLHDHIAANIDFAIVKEAVCLQFKSHRRSV